MNAAYPEWGDLFVGIIFATVFVLAGLFSWFSRMNLHLIKWGDNTSYHALQTYFHVYSEVLHDNIM